MKLQISSPCLQTPPLLLPLWPEAGDQDFILFLDPRNRLQTQLVQAQPSLRHFFANVPPIISRPPPDRTLLQLQLRVGVASYLEFRNCGKTTIETINSRRLYFEASLNPAPEVVVRVRMGDSRVLGLGLVISRGQEEGLVAGPSEGILTPGPGLLIPYVRSRFRGLKNNLNETAKLEDLPEEAFISPAKTGKGSGVPEEEFKTPLDFGLKKSKGAKLRGTGSTKISGFSLSKSPSQKNTPNQDMISSFFAVPRMPQSDQVRSFNTPSSKKRSLPRKSKKTQNPGQSDQLSNPKLLDEVQHIAYLICFSNLSRLL